MGVSAPTILETPLSPATTILIGEGLADSPRSNMGSKDKAVDAGAAAVKAGIVHIDSAQIYGTEREVIKAIEKAGLKREDVYVTTKGEQLPR